MSVDEKSPEADAESGSQGGGEPRRESKKPKKYASLLIVGSLICIAGSVYYIMRSTKEARDEDGLTKSDRAQRDSEQSWKQREKILAGFKNPAKPESRLYSGLENPPMTAAADVKVADDPRVIGILEGKKPRAYVLGAMSYRDSHIVHDSVGETPLTITYCDQSDHARVFRRTIAPQKFRMVGIEGQNMELVIDGKRYAQTAKDIPLDDFKDFTVCKWSEWKAKHPQSTLYAGKQEPETQAKE